jgi:hypothetical protein
LLSGFDLSSVDVGLSLVFGAGFSAGLSSAGIGSGSARATPAEQASAIASPSRRVTPKV